MNSTVAVLPPQWALDQMSQVIADHIILTENSAHLDYEGLLKAGATVLAEASPGYSLGYSAGAKDVIELVESDPDLPGKSAQAALDRLRAMDAGPDYDALLKQAASAMVVASRPGADPDKLTPAPRGKSGFVRQWQLYEHMARAALAAVGILPPKADQSDV